MRDFGPEFVVIPIFFSFNFFLIIIPEGVLINLSVLLPFRFGQIYVVYVVDLLLTGPELMSAETHHPII